ncbi:hypothetical protein QNO07_17275 [Streptomyces sp. 549]|uniref:hypothetical protein n=1 Tax=Streptomyces sp. 549 TaxID=3049076 RepID=UPI0024C4260B|nr:hypothetical protein [Streptomyces sp. 549]MDK1475145.1 hypothetical protein [Streptomyces sp. 549]
MVSKRHRRLGTAALTAATLLTMTSCSDGKNYSVPEDICGVPVERDLLDNLLPPGDHSSQNEENYGIGERLYSCKLRIDSTAIIVTRGKWHDESKTSLQVAHEERYSHAEQRSGDSFASWPGGVVNISKCRNDKKKAEYYSVLTTVREADQKDFEKKADVFARDLTEKLIAKQPCEKG